MTRYFSPELQGFYFSFTSLAGLQLLFELGLGNVIARFASHEWAWLSLDSARRIVGSSDARSRLVSLGRFATMWYAVAGCIGVAGLPFAGELFFDRTESLHSGWRLPWYCLSAVIGLRLIQTPLWAVLEGCNQVVFVFGMRFAEGVIIAAATWACIVGGVALWTPAISSAAGLTITLSIALIVYWRFIRVFFTAPEGPRLRWLTDVWPMQWRVAMTWASGYASTLIFTPIMFRYRGSIVAGQMGLTWSIVISLYGICAMLFSTKLPGYGGLVARRDFDALDRAIVRDSVWNLLVIMTGASCAWIILALLNAYNVPIAKRILPPLPSALLLLSTLPMQVHYAQLAYARAHRQEPLFWVCVLVGIVTPLSATTVAEAYGPTGVAIAYLVILGLQAAVGFVVLSRCRKLWRRSPAPAKTYEECDA